jgi:hypothetical protein
MIVFDVVDVLPVLPTAECIQHTSSRHSDFLLATTATIGGLNVFDIYWLLDQIENHHRGSGSPPVRSMDSSGEEVGRFSGS